MDHLFSPKPNNAAFPDLYSDLELVKPREKIVRLFDRKFSTMLLDCQIKQSTKICYQQKIIGPTL
jgi:hypothetical protein